MHMKHARLVFIFMALTLVLLLAACKKEPPAPEATPTPTPSATPVATATPVPTPTPLTFPSNGYIAKEGVNLRAEPSQSAEIVNILGENTPVVVAARQDGWYRVTYEGETAYVAEELLALGEPPRPHNMQWGKVIVEQAQLYKTPANTELSEVTLALDEPVRILREIDGYLHIVYNNTLQRYILATDVAYITSDEAATLLPTPTPRPISDQPGA